jgi:hypothetical protein
MAQTVKTATLHSEFIQQGMQVFLPQNNAPNPASPWKAGSATLFRGRRENRASAHDR